MNAVFEAIVWWEANYGLSFGYPMPRSAIMHQEGLSLYQYKKQIKELKQSGLIEYKRYMEYDYCEGYLQDSYLVQGWILTGKGRETEEYKKASIEAQEIFEKHFGQLGENPSYFYLFSPRTSEGSKMRFKEL